MENKELSELEAQEIIPEEIPVQPDETPVPEETGSADFFADILPEQAVPEEEAEAPAAEEPAEPEAPVMEEQCVPEAEATEAVQQDIPVTTVTADTAVISEIQAAVESIISQEEAAEAAEPAAGETASEEEELLPEEPKADPIRDAFGDNEGF